MIVIPLDLQKYILSYLTPLKKYFPYQPYTHNALNFYHPKKHIFDIQKKGKCICKTNKGKRCKKIVNYSKNLVCPIHQKDNFIEEIINTNYCN